MVMMVKVKVKDRKGQGFLGQGHSVKAKFAGGAFYPIDSREVRHSGVFMATNSNGAPQDHFSIHNVRVTLKV